MNRMTTYDDPEAGALIPRIRLESDANVPKLCCVIEVKTTDGRTLVQDQRMTTQDFAYDRRGVSALVRRIGQEQGVPVQAYDAIEAFAAGLPEGSIQDVPRAFALLPAARPVAKAA
jgi:hypothetical protein